MNEKFVAMKGDKEVADTRIRVVSSKSPQPLKSSTCKIS